MKWCAVLPLVNGRYVDEVAGLELYDEAVPISEDMFEGDIDLGHDKTRNIQTDLTYRWPEGKMNIEIDPDLSTNVIGVMHQALRELELRSIIRFKAHDVETDFIRIFPGGGCTSMLGRMGGRQHISLASGCDGMATIMHEFTHAIGVAHTQSRPDRDDHVTIHWENIKNNYKAGHFAKRQFWLSLKSAKFEKCSIAKLYKIWR